MELPGSAVSVKWANGDAPGHCIRHRTFKTASLGICLLLQCLIPNSGLAAELSSPVGKVEEIIGKMKAAYARVADYQTETEVRVYRGGEVAETERFLYTFKKPNHIRIDLKSPDAGTILVYPDEQGKVVAKPGGWLRFMKLHLSPDSVRFRSESGQRIDQTDMGLLIEHISRSLTDQRHGEVKLSERDGRVLMEVLAEDHFLAGVLTLYQFSVDKTLWLPVEVRELTPEGVPRRDVMFRNLRLSMGIPDDFFRIDGENPEHDHPNK